MGVRCGLEGHCVLFCPLAYGEWLGCCGGPAVAVLPGPCHPWSRMSAEVWRRGRLVGGDVTVTVARGCWGVELMEMDGGGRGGCAGARAEEGE